MRAPLLLAVAALALGVTPTARAKTPPAAKAFPFPMEVRTLPNGVRLVLVPYDSPGLVAYYTLMRVGSRNEPEPGRSGYAHFFEHMMFRGTPTHSGDEWNQTMTKLGLNTNAFTSANDRFHFDTANQTLYYSANGTTGGEVALATVTNGTAIHAHDIHVLA